MPVLVTVYPQFRDSPEVLRVAKAVGIDRAKAAGHILHLALWNATRSTDAKDAGTLQCGPEEVEMAAGWDGQEGALSKAFEDAGVLKGQELAVADLYFHQEDV
jgi:hypothetical protein